MPEVRRHFLVNQLDVNELNRVLAQIADRMDQLEGYRGKGDFKTVPSSAQAATGTTDLTQYGQVVTTTEIESIADSRVDTKLGAVIVTLHCNTLKVYDVDDGVTIIHGFGDV